MSTSLDEMFWGEGLESNSAASEILDRQLKNLNPPRFFCNEQILFSMIKPDTGFLRIKSFEGYSESGHVSDDVVDAVLTLMSQFAQ